jgi:hypothetical protein
VTMYTRNFIMIVTTCVCMLAMVKPFGIAIFCVCFCLRKDEGTEG